MITLVLGGQYGSEGKGSVVSWLAQNREFDLAIRTGSPNAGHTFIGGGEVYKMRQLPCTWYHQPKCPIYLPAGCVIDKGVLDQECDLMFKTVGETELFISPQAAFIQPNDLEVEKMIATGTTGKGVGSTRASKCLRRAKLAKDVYMLNAPVFNEWEVQHILQNRDKRILIEATQGFGLSMDYKSYPFCTSTNLTTYRILDDAEIPFRVHDVEVWMVVRINPIRIAGNSGFLFNETSWAELRKQYGNHIPDEQTTVTKKTRRVGAWDSELVNDAIARCNPTLIVLTFADYVFPNIKKTGVTQEVDHWLLHLEASISRRFSHLGIGIGEVIERGYYV